MSARAAGLQRRFIEMLNPLDGVGPLLLRLYLALFCFKRDGPSLLVSRLRRPGSAIPAGGSAYLFLAVTYLVVLVSLLFTGGGRYTSLDYWIQQTVRRR